MKPEQEMHNLIMEYKKDLYALLRQQRGHVGRDITAGVSAWLIHVNTLSRLTLIAKQGIPKPQTQPGGEGRTYMLSNAAMRPAIIE